MSTIKGLLGVIIGSKKATTAVAAIVFLFLTPLLNRAGVEVTPDERSWVIYIAISYVLGQGIADAGKEKAKIELAGKLITPLVPPTLVATASGTIG